MYDLYRIEIEYLDSPNFLVTYRIFPLYKKVIGGLYIPLDKRTSEMKSILVNKYNWSCIKQSMITDKLIFLSLLF